jgi:glyoxalase family protein
VVATAYNVPVGSSGYWTTRLVDKSVRVIADQTRFGAHVISFEDPDGMVIELIEHSSEVAPYAVAGIPSDRALRGFHSVTLLERSLDATAKVLTRKLGYVTAGAEGNRHRFIASGDAHGRIIDILVDANAARGIPGAGTVHHVAYRAKNDADQQAVQTDLQQSGLNVSPIMDRNYFHSIYFREPGGVLFEIATDAPGFDIDEPLESLGQALRLPDIYEKDRDAIEQSLPLLTSG